MEIIFRLILSLIVWIILFPLAWVISSPVILVSSIFCKEVANGLRYLRVGGRGFCLGAGKTRSQKNA